MSDIQNGATVNAGYSDSTIVNNEGPKGLRERPATLLGTGGLPGCIHAVFEIIANAVDEYRDGHGDVVKVTVEDDNTVTIEDRGRGVPMAYNSKAKKMNWQLVFCTLYASGKGSGSAYSSSEGLNGIGCTAAQYTSDFMEVSVNRYNDDGAFKHYEMSFKDGYPVGELKESDAPEGAHTGTKIRFRPAIEVFRVINIEKNSYAGRLRKKAMTTPGLRIELYYKGEKPEVFEFKNGMAEYIDTNTEGHRWTKNTLYFKKFGDCNDDYMYTGVFNPDKVYKGESRVALTFVKSDEFAFYEVYHNGAILSQGGATLDIIVDTCVKEFQQRAIELGKLQKGERFNRRDFDGVLTVCAETRCPGRFSDFENQTKVALRNPALVQLVASNVSAGLNDWSVSNSKEFLKVLDEIIVNKNARDKAESVKKSQLKKLTNDIHKIGNEPEKLLPAKCKDPSKCEIFIIEGDSAKGAVSAARDGETQAVFPLRGKIPNCFKKSFESLLQSDVIINLLTILGCGIECNSKYIKDVPAFDLYKLNYNKIIITTDADVDGGHITCLLLIFLLKFVPTLIKTGHVYIAISPLFFIDCGKGDKIYAYSDDERDSIITDLISSGVPRSKIRVQRSKGLGENSDDDMYNTVLNPETRRLLQVGYPENEQEKQELFELCEQLLGNDLDARREIIKEYFTQVRAIEE